VNTKIILAILIVSFTSVFSMKMEVKTPILDVTENSEENIDTQAAIDRELRYREALEAIRPKNMTDEEKNCLLSAMAKNLHLFYGDQDGGE